LWELGARRAFLDEAMELAKVGGDVHRAGLTAVTLDYLEFPWKEWFATTHQVDILVSYGATWSHANQPSIASLAERGIPVRLVLPDPEDERVLGELAKRYSKVAANEVAAKIQETLHLFRTA